MTTNTLPLAKLGTPMTHARIDGIEMVLELAAHRVAVVGLGEVHAVAGRGAVVRIPDGVAHAGQHLTRNADHDPMALAHDPVDAPGVRC